MDLKPVNAGINGNLNVPIEKEGRPWYVEFGKKFASIQFCATSRRRRVILNRSVLTHFKFAHFRAMMSPKQIDQKLFYDLFSTTLRTPFDETAHLAITHLVNPLWWIVGATEFFLNWILPDQMTATLVTLSSTHTGTVKPKSPLLFHYHLQQSLCI